MAATSRLAHHLRQALQEEGYRVHCGGRDDSPELAGRFWFTWSVAGMADCEVGPSCAGSWEAWAGALDHRLANSRIAMHRVDAASMPLAPFHAATLEIVRTHFGEENGDMFWLSIKRRDRAPVHDWRELQQIKNMIVGDEHEGFEVYPAESRLVDTANQYPSGRRPRTDRHAAARPANPASVANAAAARSTTLPAADHRVPSAG